MQYFGKNGTRAYEDFVYRELAEFYFSKRRYNDAAATYNAFIESNPFHKRSPFFAMRVTEVYMKGGFPRLVIEAKKNFASAYGLEAEYWNYFNQAEFPEVLGFLKTNLSDLANHYHSLYQNPKFAKEKPANFGEAAHWYREFLKSFPKDAESPAINYQLADLLLENKEYHQSAIEYERSAYDYPVNDKSQKAAYAAVYAWREHLKNAPASQLTNVKREIVRTSIRLVDTFPKHEKATIVLGAAVDDLFNMRDFPLAIKSGLRLIGEYPGADVKIRRGAWLVVAHSSYEVAEYHDAEAAYLEVLNMTGKDNNERVQLVENLAASIYKQGEQAKAKEEYREAVRHFLRIADVAPASKIRPAAEYDAAAVLIQIMDLEQAVTVLLSFRSTYPGHELQHDVTKKIAYVYKESGKFALAAQEYERVAAEARGNEDLVREAMLQAAELYEKAEDSTNSLRVYKQFVAVFPKPLEFALETYYKIAMIYKSRTDTQNYRVTLQHIIDSDAKAGGERTDRTRYLAAQSSLVIIEPKYDEFIAIKLIKPFKDNLSKKQKSMKELVADYTKLVDYQVADVTAASTYYIAEIYYNFSRSLVESERPENLSEVELEEFNLMVEEQAYPFEEKTIAVHEKNIELLANGIYSTWIDRSIAKLAKLLPARYDKPEERISFIANLDKYSYSSPRFVREDERTGYIAELGFFRYVSQKHPNDHHEIGANADIYIRDGETGQGNSVSAESAQTDARNAADALADGGAPVSPPATAQQPASVDTTGGVENAAAEMPAGPAQSGETDASSGAAVVTGATPPTQIIESREAVESQPASTQQAK
jgi:tetratricopeptide (TPR) repeat protein